MRHVIHAIDRSPECNDRRRIIIDAEILRKLVIRSLNKGTIDSIHRFSAICCNTGSKGNRRLFCNSHIDELPAGLFSLVFSKSHHRRRSGCDSYDTRILFHFIKQIRNRHIFVAFTFHFHQRFSGINMKWSAVMPLFFVSLRRRISFSFQRLDMNDNRLFAVFYCRKCIDQRTHIISLIHITVVKSHRTKQIALCRSFRLTKQSEILVQTTMIFSNRHVIVIDHNNEIATKLCRPVKSFQCFPATERSISDHRDHIAVFPFQVACLGKTKCQAHRR